MVVLSLHRSGLTLRLTQAALALGVLALVTGLPGLVVQAAPPSAQARQFFSQGIRANQQGNTLEAIGAFEKAVQADARFTDAWYNLGSMQFRSGNYEKARAAFQQVLLLNPADNQARFNLGLSLKQLGRSQEALTVFQAIPSTHERFGAAQKEIAALKAAPVATTGQPTAATSASARRAEPFASQLAGPTGMALGPNGELYIANYSKNSIIKVMPDGRRTTIVEGQGLSGPIGLVRDPRSGDLFVANYQKDNILRVTQQGMVQVLATNVKKPYNLLLDSLSNTLYVSEQETNSISRVKL